MPSYYLYNVLCFSPWELVLIFKPLPYLYNICVQRPQLVKGNMQLFSVDQQRSQAIEAHAASFASFNVRNMLHKNITFHIIIIGNDLSFVYFLTLWSLDLANMLLQVAGNEKTSTLISFASKTTNAGQITSKLHVIELGAQPGFGSFIANSIYHFIPIVYFLYLHKFSWIPRSTTK